MGARASNLRNAGARGAQFRIHIETSREINDAKESALKIDHCTVCPGLAPLAPLAGLLYLRRGWSEQ